MTISTNSVCTWNTSDVPAWVTGMPASGTGTQTIAFTVEPNQGPDRSAAIIIGGQSFAVSQAGGCSYSLAPGSHNPSAGGGASSFAVNTAAGCGWTSSGVPAWITGVPASGTGPQTINFTVAVNTGATRSANIVIGGQTFTVTQAAVACSYSLNPTSHNADGGRRLELSRRHDRGGLQLDEQRRAGVDHGSTGQRNRARPPSISPSPPIPTPLRAVPTSPSAARHSP